MSEIGRFFLLLLAVAGICAPAFANPYTSAVLADNPDAYWRLDETNGTIATDSSGNGRHGAYVNTPTLGQVGALADIANKSVSFSAASSEFVNILHTFGGVSWTEVTVEAWIKTIGPTGGFQAIVSAIVGDFVHLQAFNGGNSVVYADNSGYTTAYLPIVSDAAGLGWRHVAMTAKSGEQRLYIDGTLVGSDTASFLSILPTTQIGIGAGYAGGRFFNGSIDEVAVYRSALTGSRINAHFSAASTIPEPATFAILAVGIACMGMARRRRG